MAATYCRVRHGRDSQRAAPAAARLGTSIRSRRRSRRGRCISSRWLRRRRAEDDVDCWCSDVRRGPAGPIDVDQARLTAKRACDSLPCSATLACRAERRASPGLATRRCASPPLRHGSKFDCFRRGNRLRRRQDPGDPIACASALAMATASGGVARPVTFPFRQLASGLEAARTVREAGLPLPGPSGDAQRRSTRPLTPRNDVAAMAWDSGSRGDAGPARRRGQGAPRLGVTVLVAIATRAAAALEHAAFRS